MVFDGGSYSLGPSTIGAAQLLQPLAMAVVRGRWPPGGVPRFLSTSPTYYYPSAAGSPAELPQQAAVAFDDDAAAAAAAALEAALAARSATDSLELAAEVGGAGCPGLRRRCEGVVDLHLPGAS